jgi:hypothetical protein
MKLTATRDATVAVAPAAGCTCSCGEYRQSVRGYFNVNGTDWPHDLYGTPLSRTSFNEGCKRSGAIDYKYGYRANRFATRFEVRWPESDSEDER